MAALLAIQDLTIEFPIGGRSVAAVRRLSLEIDRDEVVGLVGESGCGKTLTALATLRLLPKPGRVSGGRIELAGEDLLGMSRADLERIRGGRIAMIFQEPMSALNPVFTVGFQICEALRIHRGSTRQEARREAARLLEQVSLAEPAERLRDYPHQLSGGQRQRVMIAIALACDPDLLIADEPTTALDVTTQAEILELLLRLRRDLGLAVLLITHDLAVVAGCCDRVAVMYAGQIVEDAAVAELFGSPAHPYTRGLLAAVPRLGAPRSRRGLPEIPGQVPSITALPPGCAFHPRCSEAMPRCSEVEPAAYPLPGGGLCRCLLAAPDTPAESGS